MNIALIVRKYQTSGGTERFNYNLSKYLAEYGHKVTIFCSKTKITPSNKNISLKKVFSFPFNRSLKTISFTNNIYRKDFSNFDIVQGCGKIIKQDVYRAGGGFHKLYLKKIGRDNLTFYDKVVMSIEKKIYNTENTKFILSVSNQLKKEIINEFNFPENRIVIFHNPVDLKQFNIGENYLKKNKKINFLFVANNFKLKGLNTILLALKNFDNFNLYVVGKDNINKFVEKIPKKIEEKIIFLKEKKGKELIKLYQNADLLLHPTFFDPFANVCLEAMACGTPVITTKINGASEIIDNYHDGIIIEDGNDVNGLIEAIKNIYNNENLLINLKENCLKKIKNYSFENYIKNLLEFYKEVLQFKKCSM